MPIVTIQVSQADLDNLIDHVLTQLRQPGSLMSSRVPLVAVETLISVSKTREEIVNDVTTLMRAAQMDVVVTPLGRGRGRDADATPQKDPDLQTAAHATSLRTPENCPECGKGPGDGVTTGCKGAKKFKLLENAG